MSVWEQVIVALSGSAVLLAAVAWLVKSLISQFLSKDIERYKSDLAASKEKELERLRTGFRAELLEKEIRLRILQERVAEVAGNVYEKLVTVDEALVTLGPGLVTADRGTNEEAAAAVAKAFNVFASYFYPREVYFEDSVTAKIKELSKAFTQEYREYEMQYGLSIWGGGIPADDRRKSAERASELRGSTIPRLLFEVREGIKRMIGAESAGYKAGAGGAPGDAPRTSQ